MESSASLSSQDSPTDPSRPTLSPFVEVLAYAGLVVVALGTVLFLGHYWSGLGLAGHVSVAAMVTVAGLAGGFVVAQIGEAGARRLGGFLRLVGTAGAAMTTAVAVGPTGVHHHGLTLLCVGLVVLVLSATLWRNLDRSLQFLSTVLGLAITLGAVGVVAHLHATSTEVALLVWFSALAIGVMSLQMLRPAPTALVVAELVSFVGAFALSFPNHLGGVLLGLLSTACAVGRLRPPAPADHRDRRAGILHVRLRIFAIYLRSADAALGAFVLGLVLVLVALWRAQHATTSASRDVSAPVEARAARVVRTLVIRRV